MSHEEAEVTY